MANLLLKNKWDIFAILEMSNVISIECSGPFKFVVIFLFFFLLKRNNFHLVMLTAIRNSAADTAIWMTTFNSFWLVWSGDWRVQKMFSEGFYATESDNFWPQ